VGGERGRGRWRGEQHANGKSQRWRRLRELPPLLILVRCLLPMGKHRLISIWVSVHVMLQNGVSGPDELLISIEYYHNCCGQHLTRQSSGILRNIWPKTSCIIIVYTSVNCVCILRIYSSCRGFNWARAIMHNLLSTSWARKRDNIWLRIAKDGKDAMIASKLQ